jgi:hypothetical protein
MIWTIIIGFAGFVMVQFIVSNYIKIVNSVDASRTKYIEQCARLAKFSQQKKLSSHLEHKIKSFYEYQFKVLNGLDEKKVLISTVLYS